MESEENNANMQQLDGRWLHEQHLQFLTAMMKHGKDWKIVEKLVQTRTGSQVRSHAQKFFIKLAKFNKERKKGKNWDLIYPQQIEREIIDNFSIQEITSETPKQISSIITCDWERIKEFFEQKKKQAMIKKTNRKQKGKSKSSISQEEANDILRNLEPPIKEMNDSNEQSYFIRIIKSKKQHFTAGNDFTNLFDLGNQPSIIQQDSQTHPLRQIPQRRQRSQSFSLPDQNNQDRLKQTLENLHRAFGFER